MHNGLHIVQQVYNMKYITMILVFACATLDKVCVYDIFVDKHEKLAE